MIDQLDLTAERLAAMEHRLRGLEVAAASALHVQAGRLSGTTNSSGDLSETFDVAHAATPSVVCTRIANTAFERPWQLITVSTTGFTVRFFDSVGDPQASASVNLDWQATARTQ